MICKYILLILLVLTQASTVLADAISIVDGRWESSFDENCEPTDQLETWPLVCDGIEWRSHAGHLKISLVGGGGDSWGTSSVGTNQQYYTGTDFSGDNATAPRTVSIDGIRFAEGTIGSLTSGQYAWGDNDTFGKDTLYVYSTSIITSQDVYCFILRDTAVTGDAITSITAGANNPLGPGNGARFMVGDGLTVGSGLMRVLFPELQSEIRVRWYMKYPPGYKWDEISSDKHLYFHTNPDTTQAITEFQGTVYRIASQNTPDSNQLNTELGEGWPVVMGGEVSDPVTAVPGDGEWHCYEVHMKMDTDSLDGIGEIFLDGVRKAYNPAVDWSGGNASARFGWEYFNFHSNQANPNNGDSVAVEYDDFVIIVDPGYTGFQQCSDGTGGFVDCIGPLPSTSSTPSTALNTGTLKQISNTGTIWRAGN